MTTMRLRGREAIIRRRDPIVSSREQIPGPSSQTETWFYSFEQKKTSSQTEKWFYLFEEKNFLAN